MHAAFAKEWEALLDVEFNKLLEFGVISGSKHYIINIYLSYKELIVRSHILIGLFHGQTTCGA